MQTETKLSLNQIIKYVFAVVVIVILYLIALNGRYESVGNGYVILDKWQKQTFVIGSTEFPVIRNGKEEINQQSNENGYFIEFEYVQIFVNRTSMNTTNLIGKYSVFGGSTFIIISFVIGICCSLWTYNISKQIDWKFMDIFYNI